LPVFIIIFFVFYFDFPFLFLLFFVELGGLKKWKGCSEWMWFPGSTVAERNRRDCKRERKGCRE